MASTPERDRIRRRRHDAARAFQPPAIRLLIIAETTATDSPYSFYSEDGGADDPLFDSVCYVLFEARPESDKRPYLRMLRRRKIFVLELDATDLPDGAAQKDAAAWLAIRIQDLAAEHVIPIGARLRDAVAKRLKAANVPVAARPVPAPVRDADPDFARQLRTALVHARLEGLIKALPAAH